jgi:hypothetical protein
MTAIQPQGALSSMRRREHFRRTTYWTSLMPLAIALVLATAAIPTAAALEMLGMPDMGGGAGSTVTETSTAIDITNLNASCPWEGLLLPARTRGQSTAKTEKGWANGGVYATLATLTAKQTQTTIPGHEGHYLVDARDDLLKQTDPNRVRLDYTVDTHHSVEISTRKDTLGLPYTAVTDFAHGFIDNGGSRRDYKQHYNKSSSDHIAWRCLSNWVEYTFTDRVTNGGFWYSYYRDALYYSEEKWSIILKQGGQGIVPANYRAFGRGCRVDQVYENGVLLDPIVKATRIQEILTILRSCEQGLRMGVGSPNIQYPDRKLQLSPYQAESDTFWQRVPCQYL